MGGIEGGWVSRSEVRAELDQALQDFISDGNDLPGLHSEAQRSAFLEQLVDSERRNRYYSRLLERSIGQGSGNPASAGFNPLSAAVLFEREGNRDEAFWMVFLSVHFGKSRRSGWRLVADVYGLLEAGGRWTWEAVSSDVSDFRTWLEDHIDSIRALEPPRRFGNHRKYESFDGWSASGTGSVVASYVDWVGGARSHDVRLTDELASSNGDPRVGFRDLYRSIRRVHRFGRTAAFDYCSTVSKLGLAPIEPAMAALSGATGPLSGAKLLFGPLADGRTPNEIENLLAPLKDRLGIGYDALEDALCNWQKSPDRFMPFRG